MKRLFLFAVLGIVLSCLTALFKLENDSRLQAGVTREIQAGSALAATLPEEPTTPQAPQKITLWNEQFSNISQDMNGVYQTQVDPMLLNRLEVGQTLSFSLPQDASPLNARLDSTHNQGRFAKIWTASLAGKPEARLTITQDNIETHLAIELNGRAYSAVIDNITGRTAVIDEASLAEKLSPYSDGITPPATDSQLPQI